jgi:hypothetical protein
MTIKSQQQSVWMIDPAPSPRDPLFTMHLRKDSYVIVNIAASEDQGDNKENFDVEGIVTVLEDDNKILETRMWIGKRSTVLLSKSRTNLCIIFTNVLKEDIRMHLKGGKEYKIITRVTKNTAGQDVKFVITAEALKFTDLRLQSDERNRAFKFRQSKDINPAIAVTEPEQPPEVQPSFDDDDVCSLPSIATDIGDQKELEPSYSEVTGQWTMDNTTGDISQYPQFLLTLTAGENSPPDTAKVRIELERTSGSKTKISMKVFDVKPYLKNMKFDVGSALQDRFPVNSKDHQDTIPFMMGSDPATKAVLNVEWSTKGTKYLLIVPCVQEESFSGEFCISALCADEPVIEERIVMLEQVKEVMISCPINDVVDDLMKDIADEPAPVHEPETNQT